MNYGILVVECDGIYQIIGAVDSKEEALELAPQYEWTANVDRDCPPEMLVINRRDDAGRYTVREVLNVAMQFQATSCWSSLAGTGTLPGTT